MAYLNELYFGMADADNDFNADAARFHRTYLDRWNLPDAVSSHEKCLLLGPKGTGKSAGALYVAHDWQTRSGASVVRTFVDFDDLNRTQSPLTRLDSRLVSPDVSAFSDAAWRIFIGTRLLDTLVADPLCSIYNSSYVESFIKKLRDVGLASDDYPSVLRAVRQRKGTISPVPSVISGEISVSTSDQVSPVQLGDAIFRLIRAAKSPTRHLLAIDGLDKAIGPQAAYWETLAALIRVVDKFRKQLREDGNQTSYVLVMCRSDVFRRVRFSESAKIAADSGVRMEWITESDDPLSILLWDFVSRKAEISTAGLFDLLPRSVTVGESSTRQVPIQEFLLQSTRYTPRDLTLLFQSIRERANGRQRASSEEVSSAADSFASNHLLSEIVSEATGLLPDEVADRLEDVLSHLPSRIFAREEFSRAMHDAEIEPEAISESKLAEYLFLQGAIGNYKPGVGHYQFYHRRSTHKFSRRGPWVVQYGLRKAFNIPWNRRNPLPTS